MNLTGEWPVETAAVGVSTAVGVVAVEGDVHWATPIASVTKLITAYAGLVAIEEGTIGLYDAAGPPGATVRHLLAHTAGYGFNEPTLMAAPGERRIYSNVGIEVFGDHLAASAGMPIQDYVTEAVLVPLGLSESAYVGSPAYGMSSSVSDLLIFARELMAPTLVSLETVAIATAPQFEDVDGVLPGFGQQKPNLWGLGFEIRGVKSPHWTAPTNSVSTFGHFGGAGTFLWIDPERDLACCCLTDRPFGPWAVELWPALSAAVVHTYGGPDSA